MQGRVWASYCAPVPLACEGACSALGAYTRGGAAHVRVLVGLPLVVLWQGWAVCGGKGWPVGRGPARASTRGRAVRVRPPPSLPWPLRRTRHRGTAQHRVPGPEDAGQPPPAQDGAIRCTGVPCLGGGGYGMVWYALRYREWLAGRSLTLPVFRAGVRGQLAVTLGCCPPGSWGGGCCYALPMCPARPPVLLPPVLARSLWSLCSASLCHPCPKTRGGGGALAPLLSYRHPMLTTAVDGQRGFCRWIANGHRRLDPTS